MSREGCFCVLALHWPQVRACECTPQVGGLLLERLRALQGKHGVIGDVRGQGLMLGVEMVQDRGTKKPATAETMQVPSA